MIEPTRPLLRHLSFPGLVAAGLAGATLSGAAVAGTAPAGSAEPTLDQSAPVPGDTGQNAAPRSPDTARETAPSPAVQGPAVQGPAADTVADPYERSNRAVHNFNMGVDRILLKPVAKGYRAVAPAPMRRGISNAVNNLQEPFTMANALLQGKPGVMMKSLGRFLINSTIGFAGLADRASEWGIPAQEEDFGQTLAVWGVGEGPYLVLPFLGPSNPRDALGFVVEFVGDPASIVITNELGKKVEYGHLGVRVVDARANAVDTVDPLLKTSSDPYTLMRSAYRQKRAFDISDGAIPMTAPEEDIFDDVSAEPMSPAIAPVPAEIPAPGSPEASAAPESADSPAAATPAAPTTPETPAADTATTAETPPPAAPQS